VKKGKPAAGPVPERALIEDERGGQPGGKGETVTFSPARAGRTSAACRGRRARACSIDVEHLKE